MFIKINELYNFLTKNGHQRLAKVLEKIALEESDFKNKYPNIYSVWESSKDKPLSAYLAQISRAEAKGIDLTKENINSFQDIIQILKGEKQRGKSSKLEDALIALKREGVDGITEKDIELAFGVGLNTEEIIYLAKDKCNHTWEEKIHYADKFKKERLALFDENTKLTDFKDIDEVRDEYFAKKNKSPVKLKDFYEKIKPTAIKNSEVIYNSKNYIVAHSKTEDAAQYWEQSCVTVDERGRVSSGLCSAHPYGSLFNSYDDEIHSFQIITKEYETLKETPRTSFMTKNKGYNLISFSIYKDSGEVAWGGHDTVNRYNEEVKKEILFVVLGEEYLEICKAIKDYCKKELSIEVKDLVVEKDKVSLTPNEIKELEVDRKSPIFQLSFENANPNLFFSGGYSELNKELFDKYSEEKAEKMSPDIFFLSSEVIGEDIKEKLSVKKLKEISGEDFYFSGEVYFDEARETMVENNLVDSLRENKYIPKKYLLEEAIKKAKLLKPSSFFNCFKYFPEEVKKDIIEDNLIEKLEGLSADKFMEILPKARKIIEPRKFGLDSDRKKYYEYNIKDKQKFDRLIYRKSVLCSGDIFFQRHNHIPDRFFNGLVAKKAKEAPALDVISAIKYKPLEEFKEIISLIEDSKIEDIDLYSLIQYACATDIFQRRFSSENLQFLLKRILNKKEDASKFFMYRGMIIDIFSKEEISELDMHFGLNIRPSRLFRLKEGGEISDSVFEDLKDVKASEMTKEEVAKQREYFIKFILDNLDGDSYLEFKRKVPKEILENINNG